jgi:hypothetical protein
MDDEIEKLRHEKIYLHGKERDRQLWLVQALNISCEEYLKRIEFIKNNTDIDWHIK